MKANFERGKDIVNALEHWTSEPNIREGGRLPSTRRRAPGENNRKFLSVAKAGAQFGVKRARAYELVHAGLIPSVRLGKRIYVPASALDRMADAAIEKMMAQTEGNTGI